MSKPERLLWSSMICLGYLNWMPQFPIDRYFVDFADPVNKLAIEVDGAAYHQDRIKDWMRQKIIETEGWKVFRISANAAIDEDEADDFLIKIEERHTKISFGFDHYA